MNKIKKQKKIANEFYFKNESQLHNIFLYELKMKKKNNFFVKEMECEEYIQWIQKREREILIFDTRDYSKMF